MNTPLSSLQTALAVAALSPVGFSHEQVYQFPIAPQPREQNYVLKIGAQVVDPFRHTTLGDFTGDGLVDCVLRRANGVEMMIDPGLFESWISDFAPGSTAIETLPGVTSLAQDKLLVAGAAGLRIFHWTGEEPAFWSQQPIGSGLWSGARRVRADRRGESRAIFGLCADQRTFVRLDDTSGSWQNETTLFTNPSDVVDFEVFEYDGVGLPELGIMTPTGVEVRDLAGALITDYYEYPVTSKALVRIQDKSEDRERIAWVLTGPADTNQFLATLGLEGTVYQDIYLNNPEIIASTAGDIDGDGDADLHMSCKEIQAVGINFDLREDEPSPVFRNYRPGSILLYYYGPEETSAPTNEAFPAVGDVDNDGDSDFCMPTPASTLYVHKGDHIAESTMQPRLVVDSVTETAQCSLTGVAGEGFALNVTFVVDLPFPDDATHAEFVLMERRDLETPTSHQYYPPVRVALPSDVPPTGTWQSTVTIPLPETVPTAGQPQGFDTIYFWFQRLVAQGPERTNWVGPACVYGLEAMVDDQEVQEYLQAISTDLISYAVSYAPSGGGGIQTALGTPEEISTVNELQCLPDLPPDKPPIVLEE